MPRPSSQDQVRFTMLRANRGFFAFISQSANNSRGSRSGESLTVVPSGNVAVVCAFVEAGLKNTISSFHTLPGCEPRQAGQFFRGPFVGAFAHERQRHGLRDAFWVAVLHGAVEIGGGELEVAAAGREQVADELVVRLVLFDGRPDPAVIRLRGVGP